MEHTNPLKVIINNGFREMQFAIHPNDGQDLDLYTKEHKMVFYAGKSIDEFKQGEGQLGNGELQLLNECRYGTIFVSNSIVKKLNLTENAILIRDKNRIFLTFK